MMKEKDVQVGNISELCCAIFVSSVQVSDYCVLGNISRPLTVYVKKKKHSVCIPNVTLVMQRHLNIFKMDVTVG
jgi:hypothetical protein